MINKGMDVNELINSELVYPSIWQNKSVFSADQSATIVPFNGDLVDIEFENPNILFSEKDVNKKEEH
jgi:hypothetical protein